MGQPLNLPHLGDVAQVFVVIGFVNKDLVNAQVLKVFALLIGLRRNGGLQVPQFLPLGFQRGLQLLVSAGLGITVLHTVFESVAQFINVALLPRGLGFGPHTDLLELVNRQNDSVPIAGSHPRQKLAPVRGREVLFFGE